MRKSKKGRSRWWSNIKIKNPNSKIVRFLMIALRSEILSLLY